MSGHITLQVAGRAPITEASTYRASCPYCRVGGVNLPVEKTGDQLQLKNVKDVHTCDLCGQRFRTKAQMTIVGVKIE